MVRPFDVNVVEKLHFWPSTLRHLASISIFSIISGDHFHKVLFTGVTKSIVEIMDTVNYYPWTY